MTNTTNNVNVAKIEVSIQMLNEYVKEPSIEPIIAVLELMKEDSANESLLPQLSEKFDQIGITQGAVLTYAPYIGILVSDNPYELE